jgi:hypothetical protein
MSYMRLFSWRLILLRPSVSLPAGVAELRLEQLWGTSGPWRPILSSPASYLPDIPPTPRRSPSSQRQHICARAGNPKLAIDEAKASSNTLELTKKVVTLVGRGALVPVGEGYRSLKSNRD